MHNTGAIILAAGGSSRLGEPKQFLHYQGKTLIQRAVDAALDCNPIVVVAGRDCERIREELSTHDVQVVHHPQWQQGIGSSIRAGVKALLDVAPNLDAFFITACDQPFVTSRVLAVLWENRARAQALAAATAYDGVKGIPALFTRPLFSDLLLLPDNCGAMQLLAKLGDSLITAHFPEGAIDIDTPADSMAWLG